VFSLVTTGNPLAWTVADVGKWLVSIEKSKFCAAFKDNEIDGSCLKLMDDETLAEIGVSLSIHRKNLLARIKQLFAPQGSFRHTHLDRNLTTIFLTYRLHPSPNMYQPKFVRHSRAVRIRSLFVAHTDDADYPHDPSIY
jgi:hypothetical protein